MNSVKHSVRNSVWDNVSDRSYAICGNTQAWTDVHDEVDFWFVLSVVALPIESELYDG